MKSLRVGSCDLTGGCRIAAAVSDFVESAEIDAAFRDGVDFVEVRLDLFPDPLSPRLEDYVAGLRPRPMLLTIRRPEEGGRWPADEAARKNRYLQLMPLADAVDVEIHAPIAAEVIHAAKAQGKTVIASFHDFTRTPADRELDALLELFRRTDADILKIAAWCRDETDRRRLAAFLCGRGRPPMIVLGMGPAGRPTRVLFPFLGSLVTYTYLGKSSAPGQLNHRELAALLAQIRGGAAGDGSG